MNSQNIKNKLLGLTLAVFLFLAGCQPAQTEQSEPEPESTPTTSESVPVESEPVEPIEVSADLILDPAITEDPDSLLVSQYLYEGLVRLDENGNVQPGLSESWVISDDQLDYIFELRPGLKFSDGTDITADIVVANFNRWFDPQNALHGDGNFPTWKKIFLAFNGERDSENRAVSQVDGVQKVDENTVIVHLNRLEPNLLNYLALPAFTILKTDALASGGYGAQGSEILSSGAYIVESWTDEGMNLIPNPNYWNPVEGEVKFIWK